MPKERVHIKRFDGVIGVTDAHDLPEGAAYYAENLDIVTQDASFVGLLNDDTYTGFHAGGAEVELFEDGNTGVSYDAVSGDLKIISFDHANKIVSAEETSSQANGKTPAMASSGQAIHVGMGGTSSADEKALWAGKVYHEQENSGVPADSYIVTDAEITSAAFGWCIDNNNEDATQDVNIGLPSASTAADPNGQASTFDPSNRYDSSRVNLKAGRRYRYYASAVYDGSQEAPVSFLLELDIKTSSIILRNLQTPSAGVTTSRFVSDLNDFDDTMSLGDNAPIAYSVITYATALGDDSSNKTAAVPAEGLESFSFYLKARTTDDTGTGLPVLSRRVSGVKIYRSEVFTDDTGKNQESEPSFIKFYPAYNVAADGVTWGIQNNPTSTETNHFAEAGEYIYIQVVDDLPGFYTFEQNTGYAATLEDMNIHWATSCVSNAYHIIGNCWHAELESVDTWLFRSKPFRYNTFDWSTDYLVLPSKPTALVSYAGRVYAFSASRVYVIDPIAFDIEETWEGVGCESEKSIVSTESGLFWASRTGIYQFVANEVVPIGLAINRLYKPGSTKENVGWLNHHTSFTPVCAYSPIQNSLIIYYRYRKSSDGSPVSAGLMYHIPTGRWVPFTVANFQITSAHTNSLGDVMYARYNPTLLGFFRAFTKTDDYRRWRFVSRQYGEKGAVHKYYHAYVSTSDINNVSGEPPAVIFYNNDSAYNDGILAPATTALDNNAYLHKYELTENGNQSWNESRTFAIELNDSVGTSGIDCSDVTIIRRRINPR